MTDQDLVAQFIATRGVTKVDPAPYKSNKELGKTAAESFFERIQKAERQLKLHGDMCSCRKCWTAAITLREK